MVSPAWTQAQNTICRHCWGKLCLWVPLKPAFALTLLLNVRSWRPPPPLLHQVAEPSWTRPICHSDAWRLGAALLFCHFHRMIHEKILSTETARSWEPRQAVRLCCVYSALIWRGWAGSAEEKAASMLVAHSLCISVLATTCVPWQHMPSTCHTAQVWTRALLPSSALGFGEDFIFQTLAVTCGRGFRPLGWACLLISKGKHFPNLIVRSQKSLYVTRHMPCVWILSCPLWGKNKVFKVYLFLANYSCHECSNDPDLGLQHFKRLILCWEDNLYVLQMSTVKNFLVWIYREEKMLCENTGSIPSFSFLAIPKAALITSERGVCQIPQSYV